MAAFAKIKKFTNWLFKGPVANTIPSLYALDKVMNLLIKIIYIILRILFIITLGKKRRDNSQFYRKFGSRVNVNFSFYLFMFFYKVIRLLRLGNPTLITLYVPKYKYKVYCPLTEDDYAHMTTREDDIIEKFQPKDGGIVVDVGAHYGRYAIIAAKRVGPKGKVIAIEADPKNFYMLNKNIKLNELSEHVITLNYAASSNKSKVKLSIPEKKSSGHTIYSSIITSRAPTEKFIEVNANTIDNLLHENGISLEQVNWIKIDVEGAELEVLKGTINIFSKSKDISFLIEIHDVGNGKTLYEPIMDLLNDYNFKKEFEKIYESGERHLIVRKQ
ncbi:MAG TPA: FkbM family methyltransferase [Nitrososphaeraceae archaeon]|nr:FkbM family methyltransferase [Nitrososphaeraceae archaeon]